MDRSVSVLGAGIVGISCALELQRRGFQVTLIDRRGPGEETSSGNAGILSYSNITPLADPALLPRLHRCHCCRGWRVSCSVAGGEPISSTATR
jgi:D-amino-acid dehydrogenase